MGYSTDFYGQFDLNQKLDSETHEFLKNFNEMRHDDEVLPGHYCQWIPTDDGMTIEWDGGEKFYYYVEWLEYLIKNILKPKDYIVNGTVKFQGEEDNDFGNIIVENNVVRQVFGQRIVTEEGDVMEELKRLREENTNLLAERELLIK